ncbi:thiol reductant ABC exporter subunit CydD [Halovulum sp. GXIMD14793]
MANLEKRTLDEMAGPEASQISRASLLGVAASLLWIPQAILVAWIFASLIEERATAAMLFTCAGGFLALAIMRASLGVWADNQLDASARRIVVRQQAQVLHHEQIISPYAANAKSSAVVAALVTDKLPMLVPYLTRYRPAMTRVIIVPLVILIVAFSMSWAIGAVLVMAGPLIPVFMALVGMAAQDASEKQMDEISNLNDLLLERLSALVDTKLLAAEGYVAEEFSERTDTLRSQTMEVLRIAFLSSTVLELFSAIGVAMVAVYVGFALLGELGFGAYATPLTMFEGMLLLLLAPEFFQPLRDMAAAWHDRATGLAVAKEVSEVHLNDATTMVMPSQTGTALSGAPSLKWSALHFMRESEFTLPAGEIRAGEAVALTGPSGVGKSTLIAALGGVLVPAEGRIDIAGKRLGPETVEAARNMIAWIPQAPFFFAGTLRDNLTLGGTPARPVEAALDLASASDIVARLPGGLEAKLGESGAGVSGGEARRLLLARAACRGAQIVLADEPTADLDDQTAAQVIQALLTLREQGATVVAASHDQRLISTFDREIAL